MNQLFGLQHRRSEKLLAKRKGTLIFGKKQIKDMISLFFQNLFLPLPTWTLTQNNKPNKRGG